MRRMKSQRVYTYEVSWQSKKSWATSTPITVRLVVGGAQVVPAERPLDPAEPDAKALFYVTPLARRGWLRGERVEVLHEGRKVQQIWVPGKVASQRLTWVLLLLTLLARPLWYNVVEPRLERHQVGPGGYVVGLVEANAGSLPPQASEHLTFLDEPLDWLGKNVTRGLDYPYEQAGEHKLDFGLCLTGVLLLLTLLSWFFHRDKRKRVVGRPIPLPEEEASPPLATRRQTADAVS
jgi:hypothetical protein